MKIRTEKIGWGNLDYLVGMIFYYVSCVCSLGAVWLLRIIITHAIKHAFEKED